MSRSRRPMPRTVSIQPGSPSFLRSEATWTSIVFAEPYQVVCQTSSRIRWRLTTAPGSCASSARSSNSFGVSPISSPPRTTRRERDVDLELADAERLGRLSAAAGPAGHGADTRDELAEAERLDDVVVRPELEADDAVDLLALGGHDDDRHVRPGAQLPADGVAVHVGQPQVEKHEVGLGRRERLAAGRDARDLEALAPRPAARGSAIASSSSTIRSFTPASWHGRDQRRRAFRTFACFWWSLCPPRAHPWQGASYGRNDPTRRHRMARKHALLISLAVALALVAGAFAAVRTTELGASASTSTRSRPDSSRRATASSTDRQADPRAGAQAASDALGGRQLGLVGLVRPRPDPAGARLEFRPRLREQRPRRPRRRPRRGRRLRRSRGRQRSRPRRQRRRRRERPRPRPRRR